MLAALCLGAAVEIAASESAGGLAASRALVARLSVAGRGEAAITVTRTDPLGGPDRVESGRIALEPPDRVRLDMTGSGERIALRRDGGEWIQPAAAQMVRLDPQQAGMVSWLWEMFLHGGASDFSERTTGVRRLRLEPRDPLSGLPDSLSILLDARGLPLEVGFADADGGATRYRFKRWRFSPARGPAAFTLVAPSGYPVVDLP